jgi:hypothetical protein
MNDDPSQTVPYTEPRSSALSAYPDSKASHEPALAQGFHFPGCFGLTIIIASSIRGALPVVNVWSRQALSLVLYWFALRLRMLR